MYWSQLTIPTLRETPAEVEGIAAKLLVRAGYMRQFPAGQAGYLLLGQRALVKIERAIRDALNQLGGQELRLPSAGSMLSVAHNELRSYKQVPQIWYSLPEGCSFHISADEQNSAYGRIEQAFSNLLDQFGVRFKALTDGASRDFLVLSETGNESLVHCAGCGYEATLETATARPVSPSIPDPEGAETPEAFYTPGRKTIADVAEFTGLPASSQMKSLVMMTGDVPVLVMVRGDHQLNEAKFASVMGSREVRPARPEEIRTLFGAEVGSLGPVGVKGIRILADEALQGRRNMIAGANRDDYHLRNVTVDRDFHPDYRDLRRVSAGDACAGCGAPLAVSRAMQLARISKLEGVDLHVTNDSAQEIPLLALSYRIRSENILRAAVEANFDKDGIRLAASLAPFDVVITPVNSGDVHLRDAAEEIHRECANMGLDALLDDRDERPGVKFKDADLIGVPYRITVGKKLAQGMVEVVERETHQAEDVLLEYAAASVAAKIQPQA